MDTGKQEAAMLSELKNNPKVVGAKQVRRSLKEGGALRVFVAGDADPQPTDPIRAMCRERGVPVEEIGYNQPKGVRYPTENPWG